MWKHAPRVDILLMSSLPISILHGRMEKPESGIRNRSRKRKWNPEQEPEPEPEPEPKK